MQQRLQQLDSLRGLAAVSVILGHFVELIKERHAGEGWLWVVTATPLSIVQASHEAVLLFFVLSGFVLALPFGRGPVNIRAFLARRLCRIYVPYWVAMVVAFVLATRLYRGPIPALGDWFNRQWDVPLTARAVGDHFLLVGSFPNFKFSPVIWSLVHEMRMSLVFPWLMLVVARLSWPRALALALGVSLVGFTADRWCLQRALGLDYFLTVHYAGAFVVGILLARHREQVVAPLHRLGRGGRWLVLAIAVCAYTYALWCAPSDHRLHPQIVDDWMAILGSALFVALALASLRLGSFLTRQPFHFLGVTSYSIYLYHGLLVVGLAHAWYPRLSVGAIMGLTLVGTMALAALSYRWVEAPSIALGRAWTRRLEAATDLSISRGRG